MIREEKSINLGSAYDFIELDKYTNNKDSIKVYFKDTGKEFTDWTLNDFGTLRIQRGVINYDEYESRYQVYMIINYEPSELPLSLNEINTIEGLKRNIVDLKSLDYIEAIRLVASRKFNIRLNQFVLFNSIVFDSLGQSWNLEYDNMEKYDYSMPNFITLEDFKIKNEEYMMSSGWSPSANDVCPHCKQKWTLNNLRDCINQGDKLYHLDCNKFVLYERSKAEFSYVISMVYNDYKLNAVKNEYGSQSYNGYWFIVSTEDGDIKIGWRKRVIQIEWLSNYKEFKFNGEQENVTKEFSINERYIHAWDVEKAIEYLRKAKRTIVKQKSII